MILTYPSPRLVIHRGDSLPSVVLVVEGVTIDPAGATATASLFRLGTGELAADDLPATLAATGAASPWALTLTLAADSIPSDLLTGLYSVRFLVTFAGPETLTVPADDGLVLVLTGEEPAA